MFNKENAFGDHLGLSGLNLNINLNLNILSQNILVMIS